MNTKSDTYDDDAYIDDDDFHFSDIDITGIVDPDKFKTTMQRIEDYLEQRRLRKTLDDYM